MELISIAEIELDGIIQQSVNSREVYNFLQIKTAYTTWIQRTVEKFDFEVSVDFNRVSILEGSGQTSIDYIVTMDMAKELCMITNTPKGKETRKYFIAAEKEAHRQKQPLTQIELIIESAKALQAVDSRLTQLEEVVADINVNKTVLPKDGYASINGIAVQIGFSHQVAKKFIDIVNPKRGSASKTLPDGSVKQYTTYKMKPVIKFASKVRQSAQPVNANEVYFTSKYTNFRFQIL